MREEGGGIVARGWWRKGIALHDWARYKVLAKRTHNGDFGATILNSFFEKMIGQ